MARITLLPWERAVRHRFGVLVGVLGPGRHRYRRRGTQLRRIDVRPWLVTVPTQEVLTADALVVKASLLLRLQVVDPLAAVTASPDPVAEIYAAAQLGLRSALAGRTLDAVLADRQAVAPVVAQHVAAVAGTVGHELLDVAVKDLTVGGELRQAYTAVAAARQQAAAALEAARGEVAATRALLNAARLVEEHPGLAHLRTLQVVADSHAHVVLTTPPPPTGG
jgi:regulator of protease activity HflC (stomatin/prohibitin superfamily)